MFRLFGSEGKKELRELSLKQREQITEYMWDKNRRDWPPLRPKPIVIPPKDLTPDTPRNSPVCSGT